MRRLLEVHARLCASVEPLTSPETKLDNFQYSAATWQKNVLQVTMNTVERYQFFSVPRWLAVQFVRNPSQKLALGKAEINEKTHVRAKPVGRG